MPSGKDLSKADRSVVHTVCYTVALSAYVCSRYEVIAWSVHGTGAVELIDALADVYGIGTVDDVTSLVVACDAPDSILCGTTDVSDSCCF